MLTKKRRSSMSIEMLLALGFFLIILLGSLLLSLPVAWEEGKSANYLQALFTATSATCVTGLTVVDTAETYSLFGEIVIIALIQVGGLGFMLFATMTLVFIRKRISLQSRALLRDSMGLPGLSGSVRTSLHFVLIVFGIELLGALLLSIRFVPQMGMGKGLYYGFFHAVSAFCNAGFDLFGSLGSLQIYQQDPYVLLIISSLIVLGGLGFAVLAEVISHHHIKKYSLHTKTVLFTTAALLVFGTLVISALEWNNPRTLGTMPAVHRVTNAWFQSVTTRTAGYFSISQMGMTDASKLVSSILMFIGASPVSTGGGIKTTTLFLLLALVSTVVHGRVDVTAFKRKVPLSVVRTALSIFVIFLILAVTGTALLSVWNAEFQIIDLTMEATSALGTVGLTSVGTANLTALSQLMLICFMYIGRVGPLTLMLVLTRRQENRTTLMHYPEEQMLVG